MRSANRVDTVQVCTETYVVDPPFKSSRQAAAKQEMAIHASLLARSVLSPHNSKTITIKSAARYSGMSHKSAFANRKTLATLPKDGKYIKIHFARDS